MHCVCANARMTSPEKTRWKSGCLLGFASGWDGGRATDGNGGGDKIDCGEVKEARVIVVGVGRNHEGAWGLGGIEAGGGECRL